MKTFSPRFLGQYGNELLIVGRQIPSERGLTVEVEGESFMVEDPRDRVATEKWRKMNLAFSIMEALTYIVGDTKVAPLAQFAPNMKNYSTNGIVLDGAYGGRFYLNGQLTRIIEMLRETPGTRRAVMSVYMGVADLFGGGGLNTPCTLSLHFLVRNGALNLHVTMRSNDVYLGLTNDLFSFTFLQEWVANQVGIPLGKYYHYTSSMHIYDRDIKRFTDEQYNVDVWLRKMSAMPRDFDAFELHEALHNISSRPATFGDCCNIMLGTEYATNLFRTAASIFYRKEDNVFRLAEMITDRTLAHVVGHWLRR